MTTTAVELEALFENPEPHWRIVPAFVTPGDPGDLADGHALLRAILDDSDPTFTVDGAFAGAARLRRLARVSHGCRDFLWVADLLDTDPTRNLLLGWSLR